MEYQDLVQKALKGRSVNQASKDWGIPQVTLNTYARAKRAPDYRTAIILAEEAGVQPGEVLKILAEFEAKKKQRLERISEGFEALLSRFSPLWSPSLAW